MHEFVYQFPDVLSKVIGELPAWAFRESIRNNLDNKPKAFEKKQRQARSNGTEAAFKHFNLSNDKKNKVVQYGLLTETSMKIENLLSNKRSLKRELFSERAKETEYTTSELKKGYKRYKEWKATGGDGEEEEITSSQEEFFDELVDIDKSIATAKGRYESGSSPV